MIESAERARLLSLYRNCRVYHGELHDHSASGGTSDGKCPLADWRVQMAERKMDFAAILDHRQIRHMYQPEWEDGLFIPGTEPGTFISDSGAARPGCMPSRSVFTISSFPAFCRSCKMLYVSG